MDFFDAKYVTEPPRNDALFGLVDNGSLARSTTNNESSWVAVVKNEQGKNVQFVPVDHNIQVFEDGNERSMCDGMLYDMDKSWLAFVEMKEQIGEWMRGARLQLESTIEVFKKSHDAEEFRYRFAYAANRRHPHFQFSQKQVMQEFYNQYKFRLLFQNNIDVK